MAVTAGVVGAGGKLVAGKGSFFLLAVAVYCEDGWRGYVLSLFFF